MTDLPLGRWMEGNLLKFFQAIISNSARKAVNPLKVLYSYAYSSLFTVVPLSHLTRDLILLEVHKQCSCNNCHVNSPHERGGREWTGVVVIKIPLVR